MDKKGSKGIVIALCMVIVVLIGSITYMFISGTVSLNVKKDNENKTEEKGNNEQKNDENNDIKEEDNDKNNIENPSEDVDEVKELDTKKCLNNNTNSYSNVTEVEDNSRFSMKINSDKKSVTLSINWEKFGPLSGASAWSSNIEEYQITGFSKNVVSTFVGGVGQSYTGETLFYLMEDGTVEYTPIFALKYDKNNNTYYEMNDKYDISSDGKYSNRHFETEGPIEAVRNVIKLYSVDVSYGTSEWKTIIGATKDGSFYDLGEIIQK